MRPLATLCLLVACTTNSVEDDVVQTVAARSLLEHNFDNLLAANGGRGCENEDGRQVCIMTTAVVPTRVLQVGDPIPSPSSLRHCSDGVCGAFVAQTPPPTEIQCGGFASCGGLAIGCSAKGGDLMCHPVTIQPGIKVYHCTCSE